MSQPDRSRSLCDIAHSTHRWDRFVALRERGCNQVLLPSIAVMLYLLVSSSTLCINRDVLSLQLARYRHIWSSRCQSNTLYMAQSREIFMLLVLLHIVRVVFWHCLSMLQVDRISVPKWWFIPVRNWKRRQNNILLLLLRSEPVIVWHWMVQERVSLITSILDNWCMRFLQMRISLINLVLIFEDG